MFCQNCGNQVAASAKFCQKCGTKIIAENTAQQATEIPMPTVTAKPGPTPPQTPLASAAATAERDAGISISDDPVISRNDNDLLKTLIGKNSDYYLKQFDKIERGEKSFNWSAFFFAPIVLLYRKQFSYFAKLILPWYVLLFVQMLFAGYAAASFDFELIATAGSASLIILVYGIAMALICARGFNKHYKTQLYNAIAGNQLKIADENTVKKFKPSALIPVSFVILSLVLAFALNSLVVTVATNSLLNDYNKTTFKQASTKTPVKNNDNTATKSGSTLTANEAKELVQKWLNNHPLPAGVYIDGDGFIHELDGKKYYAFSLAGMPRNITSRLVDIFIDPETGKLFHESSLTPLDEWYRKISAQITQQGNQGEVTYNGQPVSRFLGRSQNEIINAFGQPGKSSPASITYADGTELKFSNGNCIGIWSSNLSAFNINGITLQKNRDELISILGTPAAEGQENNLYRLRYQLSNGIVLRFAMQKSGNKAEYIAVVKD